MNAFRTIALFPKKDVAFRKPLAHSLDMTTTTLLEKLNARYANSEITRLANAGKWAEAQAAAAGVMWGLWVEIGQAAGLPCDEAARNQWLAAYAARRAAKFTKR